MATPFTRSLVSLVTLNRGSPVSPVTVSLASLVMVSLLSLAMASLVTVSLLSLVTVSLLSLVTVNRLSLVSLVTVSLLHHQRRPLPRLRPVLSRPRARVT